MQRLNVDKVQRPRRTSEFLEEPGTAVKRQSRAQRRGTSSAEETPQHLGTAQKYNTRQRSSAAGSATRVRSGNPTPQKTPLQSARVLFTAEKQRCSSNVALHNDKKWIQDQTQRITDFLKRSWRPGCMAGISEDFFARSTCLKQMSIKQFVSIINYFLHFIWGTRFAVGTNHVDDIVNILQKLNYPYQVNKSWLKTPNTTHSFGNVIVLLDFLMDFAPQDHYEFPLLELENATQGKDQLEPDLEFKAEVLQKCSEGFFLFDKQLDEEYRGVQRRLQDMLVEKRCNVTGLDALDLELDRLYKMKESLQKQSPHIDPQDERECDRLKDFIQNAHKELELLRDSYKKDSLQLEQLLARKRNYDAEIARLKIENAAHETAIREQVCNVQQRDACIERLKMLRLELQCHERTVDELQHRDYCQQVQLTIIMKKVTEEIAHLNTVLRDITYTLAITDHQYQLELSLNADVQSVKSLLPHLKALREHTSHQVMKIKEILKKYDTEIENLNYEVSVSIEPHLKAQEVTLSKLIKRQEDLEQYFFNEFEGLHIRRQTLDATRNQLLSEIENQQQLLQDGKIALQRLEEECEKIMSKGEREHSAAVEERKNSLDKIKSDLNLCNNRLKELQLTVENDKENKSPVLIEN